MGCYWLGTRRNYREEKVREAEVDYLLRLNSLAASTEPYRAAIDSLTVTENEQNRPGRGNLNNGDLRLCHGGSEHSPST